MRQRTTWIVTGVLAVVLVFVVLGLGGFYLLGQFQFQQAQLDNLRATISAGTSGTPVATPPTTNTPAATRSPNPETEPATEIPAVASPGPSAVPTLPPAPTSVSTPQAAAPGQIPDPDSGPQPDLALALAPDERGALAQHPNATLYRIGARLDPQRRTIAGRQTVRLTNTEDAPLNEVYFRLYVNAPHYNEGGIVVADVRIDGQPATTRLEDGDTALSIALPQPLAPGRQAEISMGFTTIIPDSGGGYGIFNESGGTFALYNWHPELAVYENGAWLLNPVTEQGDPTNTDAANYIVAFAAPDRYHVITSGVESGQASANGQTTHSFVGALTRNFVVAAGEQFAQTSQQVGGTTVTSYYLPGDEAGGKATLATATKSLELFSKRFGPYAYAELDIIEIDLSGGAAGMESTGLIMIGSAYYESSAADNPLASLGGGADVLAFTTAHETAHQWWYGVVGSNAYQQPWLDESLTNWSSAFYVDETAGTDAGLLARDLLIQLPYLLVVAQGDVRLDQPVDRFGELEYSAIVYGKGALMYDVLRKDIGDDKFFAFLRRYYQEHRFERVDGEQWRATLADIIGEPAARTFYQKWVEGNSISATDLPSGGSLSDLLSNPGALDALLSTPTPAP